MFKVLRQLESYEFAASSKKNFIINRLVTLVSDICIALAAVFCWMGVNFLFSLFQYAFGAGLG